MGQNVDRITEAYHGKLGPRLAQMTRDRVHWIIKNVDGSTVLDVGTSQGLVPILLGREGKKVTGIDLSKEAIAFANDSLAEEQESTKEIVQFIQGNFLHEELPETYFETIIISEVLDQYTTSKAILEKAFSLLQDNGQIIITVPFGMNAAANQKRTFYLMEIYQEMSSYFKVEHVEFMGKWIGLTGTKGANPDAAVPQSLFVAAEKAFYANERDVSVELIENQTKLSQTVAALNRKVEESKTVINGLHADNMQLEETMTNMIKNFNLEKKKLVDTNKNVMDSNKNLINQVDKKEQQLTKLKAESKEEIGQLKREIDSLKHQAELINIKNQNTFEKLENEKTRLQEKIESLIIQSEQQVEQAKQTIAKLENESQEKQQELNSAIEKLEKENHMLEAQNESLSLQMKQQTEEEQKKIEQLIGEKDSLQENIKQVQLEKEQALVKHFAELGEIEQLLAAEIHDRKQVVEELTQKVNQLEAELVQEKGKLKVVTAEKREQIQSLNAEILKLKRSNQISELENEKEVLHLKENLASLLEDTEEMTKQLIREMKDKEKLQRKYESLKNSKLGKMTMKYWDLRRK
ncbi:methyltransferase domain-containing protein [Neobacillus vireti]|uniref:methyltransferase domain-containing protein n=1 Tax=Neobacillus vireti TaxID=220686 RepID=UPI003000EA5E